MLILNLFLIPFAFKMLGKLTVSSRESNIDKLMKRYTAIAILMLLCALPVLAQTTATNDHDPVKHASVILEAAVKAKGGNRFLSYKTLMSTGQYTPYDKGLSIIPTPFIDIVVYPDSERVEFGRGKKKDRRILVNVGKTGWKYDGEAETLKDQTEKEITTHIDGVEFDIERILKGSWKVSGASAKFTGLTELMPGERADTIKVTLASNRTTLILFDRHTHLPLSMTYEQAGDAGLDKWEVKFSQYIDYDGVQFPNIVDYYINGVQISRVNYQSIKLDPKVDLSVFKKPENAKSVK